MEITVNSTELGLEMVHKTLFYISYTVPYLSQRLVYLQMCFTRTGHFNQDFKGILSKGFVKLLSKYSRMLLGSNTAAVFYSEITILNKILPDLSHMAKKCFLPIVKKNQ